MKNILTTTPTKENLLGMVKTDPMSASEQDYYSIDQALLDDLRDDMLFSQADTRDYVGDL